MRTSEQRVGELHRRMKLRRRARARRNRMIGVSAVALCLAAALIFAVGVSRSSVQIHGLNAGGVTASIFAEHEALGFVLVALVAFCLGALVTVLCHRLASRRDDRERWDDQ